MRISLSDFRKVNESHKIYLIFMLGLSSLLFQQSTLFIYLFMSVAQQGSVCAPVCVSMLTVLEFHFYRSTQHPYQIVSNVMTAL